MGIAAVGAAVLNVVEHTGEHLPLEVTWLLLGAISMTLISIVGLTRTIQLTSVQQGAVNVGARVMLISAILVLSLGFLGLDTIPMLIAVIFLLLAPIFFALRVWITLQSQET
jgi:hypothetical protein